MDLAVFVILLVLVITLLRDIKWVTYLIGILEIFLRLLDYIANNLGVPELESFVNRVFPDSLFAILGKYTNGVVYEALTWVLIIFLVWFLIYLVKYLFGRR